MNSSLETHTGNKTIDPAIRAKVLRQLEEETCPNPEAIRSAFRAELITEEQMLRLLPKPQPEDTLFLILHDSLQELCTKISKRIKTLSL